MTNVVVNALRRYNGTELSVTSQFHQYNTFQDYYAEEAIMRELPRALS
jgi:hypothetical protein